MAKIGHGSIYADQALLYGIKSMGRTIMKLNIAYRCFFDLNMVDLVSYFSFETICNYSVFVLQKHA